MQNARTQTTRGTRWTFTRVLLVFAVVGIGFGAELRAAPFMAGADISSLPVHEGSGAVYRDDGQAGDAIEIFSDHGVNWYRLRLFVNPQFENNYNGGYEPFVAQDLDYTIALAQRVKQAGGKVLLDFHYSDTWADPGHQWKPEAWRSLETLDALEQQVYDYTKQSIEAFKTAGVLPEMVQIGNEIPSGFLWNGEYVSPQNQNNSTVGGSNTGYPWTGGSNNTGFDRLATLLQAGIDGAKDGAGPGEEPLIMIHHDKGAQWGTTSYYFDKLVDRELEFDVIGYSYYPKFHYSPQSGNGGIDDVIENLNNTANQFGKPIVLVEAGFPSRGAQFEPDYEFDVSPAGQQEYLQALVDAVQNVPSGLGWGVFWWYAEARPTSGLPVWEGGRYGLFDQNGNLLPAASVFEQFIVEGVPGDYNGNGFVDAADYTLWRDHSGQMFVLQNERPDAMTPGEVDLEDYEFWSMQIGATAGSGSVGATDTASIVPDPASWMLLACMAALGVFARPPREISCRSTTVGVTGRKAISYA